MTKNEILALVAELHEEEKKTKRVPHYPDYVYTERYKELFYSDHSPLRSEKIFRSSVSGEMLAYFDLETWCCDFENDYYISSNDFLWF